MTHDRASMSGQSHPGPVARSSRLSEQLESGFARSALLAAALAALVAGLASWSAGNLPLAEWFWTIGVAPVLVVLLVQIILSLARGDVGLDVLAAVSMSAALAVGENLAASVVAVMYAGGTFLESYAAGRARREMTALLRRVPRQAARYTPSGIEEVALEAIAPGDRLLIRQGDVVPVDGTVASAAAHLDLSALTGESLPLRLAPGDEALSGATNAGQAFDLIARRDASRSTFAGIVRLVEAAHRSKAPMARMADRWSLVFLLTALAIAGAAWGLSGDPVRAVAVLVVATPCPLILAVPVALVAGLSRAARFGVMIKGADRLETMARVRTLILDKTGTLTEGQPKVLAITPSDPEPALSLLRLAAAVDQASAHPMARALVAEARAKGIELPRPLELVEVAGEGVSGTIEGRSVAVGNAAYVAEVCGAAPPMAAALGRAAIWVAVDGHIAGLIQLGDPLRPGAAEVLALLRGEGIDRIILATGDRDEVARQVARDLALDACHADLRPEDKLALVRAERANGPVMLVGDGVNDAPALAAADVGVAMGARGAAAAAEAADVVVMLDRLDPIASGVRIARAARGIAMQSVVAGIGLSTAGMIAAAFGLLTPVQGALLQEAIDVAVILNALRVLRVVPEGEGRRKQRLSPALI